MAHSTKLQVIKLLAEISSSSEDETLGSVSSDEEHYLRRPHQRSQVFVEKVVSNFDALQFREHFRISRDTFNYILTNLSTANVMPLYKPGRPNVTAEKALLLTIWYLANTESFRQLGDRFNVTRSTALGCVRRVIDYLVQHAATYIHWPNNTESADIAEGIRKKQGFSGVIGAIDGCHIGIKRPKDQATYCNRKGVTSIILQGVCDDKKRFTDIYYGEPGSMHDARVLRRSQLYAKANIENLPGGRYLLGDSAYPNTGWLVTPFKDTGNLSPNQRQFNFKLSSTRIVIEHAFGLLKGRFRRLRYFENSDIAFIVKAVTAACVLHNICLNFDDLEVDFEESGGCWAKQLGMVLLGKKMQTSENSFLMKCFNNYVVKRNAKKLDKSM